MKKLIFGSVAAKRWFPDFPRNPADLDYVSQEEAMSKEVQHYWWPSFQWILDNNKDEHYVDPETLYALKAAHSHFGQVHLLKTLSDVLFFQKKGVKLDHDLYKMFLKDFKEFYGKRHATLEGKGKDQFFKDAVKRDYDHDSIHECVAYYDEPLYYRIRKNENTVACSQEKFEQLSPSDKIRLVQEEVFVTALERFLVPQNFNYSAQLAYSQSLNKLLTTMSSGFFRLYMIEHYQYLWKMPNRDWINKFHADEKKVLIKL